MYTDSEIREMVNEQTDGQGVLFPPTVCDLMYDMNDVYLAKVAQIEAKMAQLESELAYLRFFAGNANFGPAHTHVLMAIQAAYEATGAQVPETWRVE